MTTASQSERTTKEIAGMRGVRNMQITALTIIDRNRFWTLSVLLPCIPARMVRTSHRAGGKQKGAEILYVVS